MLARLLMELEMERPHRINPGLALFIADSLEVSERLDIINQKLLAVIATIPQSSNLMQVDMEHPKVVSGDQGWLEGFVDPGDSS